MKTGQFAQKHGVTQSMVGFYIKQGLLLPTVINGRYDFKDADDEDMLVISNLKRWQFSLEDICSILTQIRLKKDSADPSSQKLLAMLVQKRREILEERAKINSSLLTLDKTIR